MVYPNALRLGWVLAFGTATTTGLVSCRGSKGEQVRVIRAVAPAFPEVMAQAHSGGQVTVRVTVESSGKVKEAQVVAMEGQRATLMVENEYESLARQWVFEGTGDTERLNLQFVYQLMPPDTMLDSLGTTFEAPATVTVRGRAVVPEQTRDYAAPK